MVLPYFKLYIADYMHGTRRMTAAQKGGYMDMLIEQWDIGYLKNNRTYLEEISQLKGKNLDKVLEKFKLGEDGFYRNDRIDAERQQAEKTKRINGNNGSLGGKKKAENIATATITPPETVAEGVAESSHTIGIDIVIGKENTINKELGGKTKVGNREFDCDASDFLWQYQRPMAETTLMQHPDLDKEEVLRRFNTEYPRGFGFTTDNHVFNSFKRLCKFMMEEKQRQNQGNINKKSHVKSGGSKGGGGMQSISNAAREILSRDQGPD